MHRWWAESPTPGWVALHAPPGLVGDADLEPALHAAELIPGVLIAPGHVQVPVNALTLPPVKRLFDVIKLEPPAHEASAQVIFASRRRLFRHQEEAVQFALARPGTLLADVMGLGKTSSAIVAAETYARINADHRPRLIVAPLFTRDVWKRELLLAGAIEDESQFCALATRAPSSYEGFDPEARWYFAHYDVIQSWWWELYRRRPVTCIVDEAHYVKNSRSKRSKGTLVAAAACPFRMLLTGTPLLNRPAELWHILTITTGKATWGGYGSFRIRYAGAVNNGYGLEDQGATHTDELRDRLAHCYLRRSIADADIEMPRLSRTDLTIRLGVAEQQAHDGLLAGSSAQELYEALVYGRAGRETLRLLSDLRKITSGAKLRTTIEYAVNTLEQGESIVIFTWERATAKRLKDAIQFQTQDTLDARGAGFWYITGEDAQDMRDACIAAFQKRGGCLVATLGALKEGVTLHRARFVHLHDLDWTPSNILQAEARVYRIGQKFPCVSSWAIAENSIDTIFARVIVKKAEAIGDVLNDDAALKAVDDVDLRRFDEDLQSQVERWLEGCT